MTKHQAAKKFLRKKVRRSKVRMLSGGPQRKVMILKKDTRDPRKPNSANRRVAYVRVLCIYKHIYVKVPGEGNLGIKENMLTLLEGIGLQDTPGVNYSLIRGSLAFNVLEVHYRNKSRSKFGAPKDLVYRPISPAVKAREAWEFAVSQRSYWDRFRNDLKMIFPYYDPKNRHRPWD